MWIRASQIMPWPAVLVLAVNLMQVACTSTKRGHGAGSSQDADASIVATTVPAAKVALPAAPPEPPHPPAVAECPVQDVVCTMDFSPVVCYAQSYEGKAQTPDSRLMVWASNSCAGRIKFQKQACAQGLVPSKFVALECAPDPSGGHCPGETPTCAGSPKPTTCIANAYAKQPLTGDQALSATGSNECATRAALRNLACRANLDPQLLGEIRCSSGRTAN